MVMLSVIGVNFKNTILDLRLCPCSVREKNKINFKNTILDLRPGH